MPDIIRVAECKLLLTRRPRLVLHVTSPGMADGQQQLLASQPVLLMMKGHPGSGKSSVAEQLAGAKLVVLQI